MFLRTSQILLNMASANTLWNRCIITYTSLLVYAVLLSIKIIVLKVVVTQFIANITQLLSMSRLFLLLCLYHFITTPCQSMCENGYMHIMSINVKIICDLWHMIGEKFIKQLVIFCPVPDGWKSKSNTMLAWQTIL